MTSRTFFRLTPAVSLALLLGFAFTTNSQAVTTVTNISPNFGTTGSVVTIYGTNFGTSTGTVKFNGVSATVGTWSTTKITATVPAAATTGLVAVAVFHGSAVSSMQDFNVLPADGALAMGAFPPLVTNCSLLPAGNNCISQYQTDVMPNIDGVVIVGQWSSIESSNSGNTGSGGYSWTSFDSTIGTYVGSGVTGWDASKKLGIVLSPVSNTGSNTSTSSYVFSTAWATTAGASAPLDECTCGGYSGDGATGTVNTCWNISSGPTTPDYTGFPLVFEKPFYVALENFYSNAVSHINAASYAPYVAYIRMGLSGGGEEYPFCSTSIKTYLSISSATFQTDWTNYANTMFTYEGGLGSQQPLLAAPNGNGTSTGIPSDAYADTEAADAVAQGLMLGSEGLQSSDTFDTNCTVSGGSSNDWCYTFQKYDPVIRELQTLAYSTPSENTCTTNYFSATNSQSQNTGSLVCLLPFVEGKANSIEIYPNDMFLTYDSNDPLYATYGAAYASAISHLRNGD
jgi:hypothetical protein